jgi:hypothetical protein
MNIGREIWGPFAWHLLHVFSINNNSKIADEKKHNYYIFYSSFIYVLPCLICSEHYSDIIYTINPLDESKINRAYIKRWVYNTHNIVNNILDKEQYSYQDCIKNNTLLRDNDIYFFINNVFRNFDFENMSLYKFDQIYNFFINFCILYPNLEKRKKLKKLINNTIFKKIQTPNQFKLWLGKNLPVLEEIIKK